MSASRGCIHPSAVIDPHAELAEDVEVGPYAVIGAGVRIGKGCKIKAHAVVEGRTTLGEGNVIFQFASVGSQPQDLKYKGEPSELVIGDRNTIREYVSVNPGTSGGGMITRVGNQNLLMMYCHIAHDSFSATATSSPTVPRSAVTSCSKTSASSVVWPASTSSCAWAAGRFSARVPWSRRTSRLFAMPPVTARLCTV